MRYVVDGNIKYFMEIVTFSVHNSSYQTNTKPLP